MLYLQNNYLSGAIPESISNCTRLESLDLSLNNINGTLPASLGKLGELRDLILWQNFLEGEIRASLENLDKLEHLILDYNGLIGIIPSELSKCKELNWISLARNQLSGPIPAWLGQLSNLAILKLSNNSFSGPILAELGNCQSLCWCEIEAISPTTPRSANTADPGSSPSAFDSDTGSSLGHIGCLRSIRRAASPSLFVAFVLGFLFCLPRDASPRHRPPASSRRPHSRQTWQWIGCLVLFAVAIGGEQEDTVEALSRAVQRSGNRGGIKGHRWRQHAVAACGGETV
ncbi:hypothetical protein ZEAMMB73_Zm00001d014769 [Zea mays]|uniref:Uncharacterized protein n=1 Tax=Zea mays TaxID=4577 RepID=A0A1D6GW95_MAIZE|nr:hypothetical protein ZEAMMB73_Zm00001d014769 [Zea mays]